MKKKNVFTHNPSPHVKIPIIIHKIESTSLTNIGLCTSDINFASNCNVSNYAEAFFLAHSIALASLSFYRTYGLPRMWAFIATWSCCLGPLSWVEVHPNLPNGKVKEWSFSTCSWRSIWLQMTSYTSQFCKKTTPYYLPMYALFCYDVNGNEANCLCKIWSFFSVYLWNHLKNQYILQQNVSLYAKWFH